MIKSTITAYNMYELPYKIQQKVLLRTFGTSLRYHCVQEGLNKAVTKWQQGLEDKGYSRVEVAYYHVATSPKVGFTACALTRPLLAQYAAEVCWGTEDINLLSMYLARSIKIEVAMECGKLCAEVHLENNMVRKFKAYILMCDNFRRWLRLQAIQFSRELAEDLGNVYCDRVETYSNEHMAELSGNHYTMQGSLIPPELIQEDIRW